MGIVVPSRRASVFSKKVDYAVYSSVPLLLVLSEASALLCCAVSGQASICCQGCIKHHCYCVVSGNNSSNWICWSLLSTYDISILNGLMNVKSGGKIKSNSSIFLYHATSCPVDTKLNDDPLCFNFWPNGPEVINQVCYTFRSFNCGPLGQN